MEELRNCEVKFKRDYEDDRLFYELDVLEDNNVDYYSLNMVVVEKIAHVKGMSQLEIIDYIMEHDISSFTETIEYQYVFRDMCDEMKKVFYKEEKRLEVQDLDKKYKDGCLDIIHDYLNELYPDADQLYVNDLNDDELYRFGFYIEKGYTLSKILSLLKKPD